MSRQFKILVGRDKESNITSYTVSDATDEEITAENQARQNARYPKVLTKNTSEGRDPIVIFPVSDRYDQDEQRELAHLLCDYLNRVKEAQIEAQKNQQLYDALVK